MDEFFTRGRHETISVYCISQSFFGLPRQSIGNNSDIIILFKQTFRNIQSKFYAIEAYDKTYDEFKAMCHIAWSENFKYLCIDMTKDITDGKYRFFNKSKNTDIECIPESEVFYFLKVISTKNRQELKTTEELALIKKSSRREEVRLQDRLGKQNFHKNTKKLFEPLTDTKKPLKN